MIFQYEWEIPLLAISSSVMQKYFLYLKVLDCSYFYIIWLPQILSCFGTFNLFFAYYFWPATLQHYISCISHSHYVGSYFFLKACTSRPALICPVPSKLFVNVYIFPRHLESGKWRKTFVFLNLCSNIFCIFQSSLGLSTCIYFVKRWLDEHDWWHKQDHISSM